MKLSRLLQLTLTKLPALVTTLLCGVFLKVVPAFGDTTPISNNTTVGTIDTKILGVPISLDNIIAGLVQLAIAVAGLVFFFMVIFGGIRYLSAGGDEKAAAAARQTLTNAFIGLIIVVASFLIVQLLFFIFKVPGISLGG